MPRMVIGPFGLILITIWVIDHEHVTLQYFLMDRQFLVTLPARIRVRHILTLSKKRIYLVSIFLVL